MKGLLLKDFYMARKYCRAYVVIAVVFSLFGCLGKHLIPVGISGVTSKCYSG